MARSATFSAQPDAAALLVQATAATGPQVRGLMVTPAGTAQSRPG
jgi:hypothetical protein